MKVTISERAEQNLDKITRYLEGEWSVRVRDKFLEILKKKIEQISRTPHMYRYHPGHSPESKEIEAVNPAMRVGQSTWHQALIHSLPSAAVGLRTAAFTA
jgi:plasmid stabilization system protein ParE